MIDLYFNITDIPSEEEVILAQLHLFPHTQVAVAFYSNKTLSRTKRGTGRPQQQTTRYLTATILVLSTFYLQMNTMGMVRMLRLVPLIHILGLKGTNHARCRHWSSSTILQLLQCAV